MTTVRVRILAAIATTLLLGACGQSESVTAPESALYDGGHTFGGGNKESTTSEPANSSTMTECEVGGIGFGSGGRTCPS